MRKAPFILAWLFAFHQGFGQIEFGPRAGFQTFLPIYKDAVKYKDISPSPKVGYNAGLALNYKVDDLFSYYAELSYSRRGKLLTGGIKDQFRNNAVYHYIEFPFLARLTFHESIRGNPFDWFLNAGGAIDYWLAGNGYIKSWELEESAIERVDYRIKYRPKSDAQIDKVNTIYLEEPTRMQVGLVAGGGIKLPLRSGNILAMDLRYFYRHSWLGRDNKVDVGLFEYYEDFRTMEHVVSINVAYMFDYTLGENRKGGSTRGKTIKTKRIHSIPGTKGKDINKIRKGKR